MSLAWANAASAADGISQMKLFAYESVVAISKQEVQHVAKLARLQLSQGEAENLTTQLGNILDHIEQLKQLDTSDVEPTRHVAVEQMPVRPDSAREGLPQDLALSSAARTSGGGFAVPGFIEE